MGPNQSKTCNGGTASGLITRHEPVAAHGAMLKIMEAAVRLTDLGTPGTSIQKLSFGMICSILRNYDILAKPEGCSRNFAWATSPEGACELIGILAEEHLIIVCNSPSYEQASINFPRAFFVVVTSKTISTTTHAAAHNAIIIDSPDNSEILALLQGHIIKLIAWKTSLERCLEEDAGMDTLLELGEEMLQCELAVVSPKRTFTSSGETLDTSSGGTGFAAAQKISAGMPNSTKPVLRKHGNEYHLELSVQLAQSRYCIIGIFDSVPTTGSTELFSKYSFYVSEYLKSSDRPLPSEGALDETLHKIILGEQITARELGQFETAYGISEKTELRLAAVDLSDIPLNTRKLLKQSKANFHEKSTAPCEIDNMFLFLFRSNSSDSSLSNKEFVRGYNSCISEESNSPLLLSQVYSGVTNTKYAYKQVLYMIGNMDVIQSENAVMAAADEKSSVISFEECLLLFLIADSSKDIELRNFCLSHTILEKLAKEDRENGTENARILMMYQYYNGKTSIVANKMHMHRNTVIYHLDKIKQRFGFDLDDPCMRNRLLVDSKVFNVQLALKREGSSI